MECRRRCWKTSSQASGESGAHSAEKKQQQKSKPPLNLRDSSSELLVNSIYSKKCILWLLREGFRPLCTGWGDTPLRHTPIGISLFDVWWCLGGDHHLSSSFWHVLTPLPLMWKSDPPFGGQSVWVEVFSSPHREIQPLRIHSKWDMLHQSL